MRIRVTIEKPNYMQKIVIILANYLLWLSGIIFKNDPERLTNERKEIIKDAYETLKLLNNQKH